MESSKALTKQSKSTLLKIPKLDDANNAGKKTSNCTLILTEGDSAKALAVAGLSVIGRDNYGIFPLRGKLMNVRAMPLKKVVENNEISSIIQILGLDLKKTYESAEEFNTLRYKRLCLMTDQDHDGSHIKGLLLNVFHQFWPKLVTREGFLQEFITPLIKVSKNNSKGSKVDFFTMQDYDAWKKDLIDKGDNVDNWSVKYYKGLGTSTALEAKDYFSSLDKHLVDFKLLNDDANNSDNSSISKGMLRVCLLYLY